MWTGTSDLWDLGNCILKSFENPSSETSTGAEFYVAGFFFPVVPKGKARIRTQLSAALSETDVDFAVNAFAAAGRELGIV